MSSKILRELQNPSIDVVILASQNQHKYREFCDLLPAWRLELAQPFRCVENAVTYWGNALLKARMVQQAQPDSWVLADDSGLELAALDGRPGIFSARYGGPELAAAERTALLLEELADSEKRRARFVCCLVLLSPASRVYVAQSCVQGRIAHQPRSLTKDSFGYDPIFELSEPPSLAGKTMAELQAQQKNSLSHRSLACARLRNLIQN